MNNWTQVALGQIKENIKYLEESLETLGQVKETSKIKNAKIKCQKHIEEFKSIEKQIEEEIQAKKKLEKQLQEYKDKWLIEDEKWFLLDEDKYKKFEENFIDWNLNSEFYEKQDFEYWDQEKFFYEELLNSFKAILNEPELILEEIQNNQISFLNNQKLLYLKEIFEKLSEFWLEEKLIKKSLTWITKNKFKFYLEFFIYNFFFEWWIDRSVIFYTGLDWNSKLLSKLNFLRFHNTETKWIIFHLFFNKFSFLEKENLFEWNEKKVIDEVFNNDQNFTNINIKKKNWKLNFIEKNLNFDKKEDIYELEKKYQNADITKRKQDWKWVSIKVKNKIKLDNQ